MMELWYDAHADCDLWIAPLPQPITKLVTDLRPGDVEFDSSSRLIYRHVEPSLPGLPTVRITYDALYTEADIDESQWRQVGQWGVQTKVIIDARVVYVIREDPL